MRGQSAANARPMRGGRGSARRAPELVSGRRDVPGVLQDMLGLSRSTSGPKEISRTARRAKETRREHEEGQGDQQRGKKPAESLGLESQRVPGHLA